MKKATTLWQRYSRWLKRSAIASAAVTTAFAASSAYATITLSTFGLDTFAADFIALMTLGFGLVASLFVFGLSGEAILGMVSKWTKKIFGGR